MRLVAKELGEVTDGHAVCHGYELLVQASKDQFKVVLNDKFESFLIPGAQACN